MKTLAELKSLNHETTNARRTYLNAVVETLKEVGKELPVVDSDYDPDMGYPEGLLLAVPNKHGNLVDCVYDRIKVENDAVKVHIAYWDDGTEDSWQYAGDIPYNDLLDIYSSIDWGRSIKKGTAGEEKVMVLCSYDDEYQEKEIHLVVNEGYLNTEAGKKAFKKWMHEHFGDACDGEDDEKELKDCINDLLTEEEGFFGIRYYFEDYPVLL